MQDYYKRLLQLPLIGVPLLFLGLQIVHAGVLQSLYSTLKVSIVGQVDAREIKNGNSQTIEALKPASPDDKQVKILAQASKDDISMKPSDTSDEDDGDSDTLDQTIIYEVKDKDTITSVSKMFDVSKDTIRWANNLKSDSLKAGQILLILPVTGVMHEVKKGDTIESIAKKYKADPDDVYNYNGLNSKSDISIGDIIIVPDGKKDNAVATTTKKKTKKSGFKKDGSSKLIDRYTTNYEGYYIRPLIGGVKTQGLHGHNGVDLAGVAIGTPILAAADGTVIVARGSGYNGGYGEMIMIKHANGTQTVYGHLSAVYVTEGQSVSQGDRIGALGNTGKSTGPHLHFEVRGAVNPF